MVFHPRKSESILTKSKSVHSNSSPKRFGSPIPSRSLKSHKNSFVSINKSDKKGKVEYHKDTSRSDRCIRINCGET
jgi:hypothetical protein